MQILNSIFNFYDKAIGTLPVSYQSLISFSILLFFIWLVYIFVKSKNWIFLALIIVMLPGTWPATKNIGLIVWALFKGLFARIKGI